MPKKQDDLIIEDATTRRLLEILLGKWSDVPDIEEYFMQTIQGDLVRAEAVLRNSYLPTDYNAGVGRKPAMDYDEWIEARQRRMQSTIERFRVVAGELIKARLIQTLNEAALLAVEAERSDTERRIKSAAKKRKGKFTRGVKKIIADTSGRQYYFGRPKEITVEEVERRSIEIIRTIGAGKRDMRKVAVAFYGGAYLQVEPRERKRAGDKYAALLKRVGLSFDGLVEQSRRG